MDWLQYRDALAMREAPARMTSPAKIPRSPATPHHSPFKSVAVAGKESTFMSLPPELRLEIYAQLFQDEVQRIKPEYQLPGILTACRQTYNEAIGLFYATSTFRCLDEDSTVSWLISLPQDFRRSIRELKYDTRWMIFIRPYIPVPGAEYWLFQNLVAKLAGRGFDLQAWNETQTHGEGRVKVSWYQGGKGGGVRWTDKPGLIEVVER